MFNVSGLLALVAGLAVPASVKDKLVKAISKGKRGPTTAKQVKARVRARKARHTRRMQRM